MSPQEVLCAADPRLARVIDKFGPLGFTPEPVDYHSFVKAITFQQLSGKAATTIFDRMLAGLAVAPGERCQPKHFRGHTIASLRPYGVSQQKASYLIDLAEKTFNKEIHFNKFHDMDDDHIIEELTKVRGIGEWSVQMVLMFSMCRPDVMPSADLGIRHGVKVLDEMDRMPTPKEVLERAEIWKPFRSYASLYLWKLKDEGPSPVETK